MSDCPICGHKDGACEGTTRTNTRQIITSTGVVKQSGPERVPRPRNTKLGREGYVGDGTGKLEYYDPKRPHIRLVSDEQEIDEGGAPNNPRQDEPTAASVDRGGMEAEPEALVPAGDEGSAPTAPKPRRTRKPKADAE